MKKALPHNNRGAAKTCITKSTHSAHQSSVAETPDLHASADHMAVCDELQSSKTSLGSERFPNEIKNKGGVRC